MKTTINMIIWGLLVAAGGLFLASRETAILDIIGDLALAAAALFLFGWGFKRFLWRLWK